MFLGVGVALGIGVQGQALQAQRASAKEASTKTDSGPSLLA